MIRRRVPGTVVLLLGLAPGAWAQLDLPSKPPPEPRQPGDILLPPTPPRGNLAPRPGPSPTLDLPSSAVPTGAVVPVLPPGAETVARELFAALARKRDAAASVPVVERLLALGPEALPVARAELASSHLPTLLAAARVCLIGGASAERAAVAERLTRPLPAEAAAPLLGEFLASDPMLGSPEYMAGLLDHPSAAMRGAAASALGERLANVPLTALAPVFDSGKTGARAHALELVARLPDPLAWNLVASRLGDSSAQLARRAADILARVDEAEALLLERSFPGEPFSAPLAWDRRRAYALLALIEREDLRSLPLLEGSEFATRVEALRAGLASSQPLVVGACAVALARIGFRAPARLTAPWLDVEVPHMLVRCGTGAEFHGDFSSLERPALRALGLLSGQNLGSDGEAWRRWWVANASGFHARHAVIELVPGASLQLLVAFRDERGRSWWLLGPERTSPPEAAPCLRLDVAGAERLRVRLEAEGVFGVERLPGLGPNGDWDLLVSVGGQEKRFARSGSRSSDWLDELRTDLGACVEENRWQQYFDGAPDEASAWLVSERPRWAAMAPLERRRALVQRILASGRRVTGAPRDERVLELARLYDEAGVPAGVDFEPLLGWLAEERAYGPRAETLLGLARVAAGAAGAEAPEALPRERLLALGLARFGPEADETLARIVRDLEPGALRRLAEAPDPRARALAAVGLVRSTGHTELLRTLLKDAEDGVVLATLQALVADPNGGAPAGELRPELLAFARGSERGPRTAALGVLARLGGKEVHDLALEALADEDEGVQLAGVAALAELAEARDASLLASLFGRGTSSPLHAAARRGLERMGAAGVEECLRLARSAGPRARREAALFLAQALVPEAAGMLLTLVSENPADERVRWELSVLSGLDLSAEQYPERAAWSWWDLVVHDDPLAWLLSAAGRAGLALPERVHLVSETGAPLLDEVGTRFLLELAALPAPHLVERAARELERRLDVRFPRPETAGERAAFLGELRAAAGATLGD